MIGDTSTELFGCRETKRVFALSNGHTVKFEELHPTKRALIFEKLLSDEVAVQDLKDLPQAEAIERFAFCVRFHKLSPCCRPFSGATRLFIQAPVKVASIQWAAVGDSNLRCASIRSG